MTNFYQLAEVPPWIAVVDDDPFVLTALYILLRASGYGARAFASAQHFLTALSDGLPECLITDLQMPEMTGLELHQCLKSRGIQIPTIIISGQDDGGVRKRCESAGVIAFLSKPIEDIALFAAIDDARRKCDQAAKSQSYVPKR